MTAGEKDWTASNTRIEEGRAIDATIPVGYEEDFHRPVYPIKQVSLDKFFSQEQTRKIKSFMKGWVQVLAKTGR